MTEDLPPPIPAATLIVMRPGRAAPELLILERAGNMAFAAGALAFPGGRIDPDDVRLGERLGCAHGAAVVAATRETIEEVGLAPGLAPAPSAATIARIRQELEEGAPFSALLEMFSLKIVPDALTPFARWCPNFRETRRFDTIFFLAEAPAGAEHGVAAAAEAARLFWASAADVLAEIARGDAHAIFPTRRNLERLALFSSIAEARADAARHGLRKIVPWVEERGGVATLCIPEDAGYPVTSEPLATARRA